MNVNGKQASLCSLEEILNTPTDYFMTLTTEVRRKFMRRLSSEYKKVIATEFEVYPIEKGLSRAQMLNEFNSHWIDSEIFDDDDRSLTIFDYQNGEVLFLSLKRTRDEIACPQARHGNGKLVRLLPDSAFILLRKMQPSVRSRFSALSAQGKEHDPEQTSLFSGMPEQPEIKINYETGEIYV